MVNRERYNIAKAASLARFARNKSVIRHLLALLILFQKVQARGPMSLRTIIGIQEGMGPDCLGEKAMQSRKS